MYSLLPQASLGAIVMLGLVLRWSTVEAQSGSSVPTTASVNQANKQQAKQLTKAAVAAHNAGNYTTAIALYKKAYALFPHPFLYCNLGRAYRLLSDLDQAKKSYNLDEAKKSYTSYLDSEPEGKCAPEAREFLASLPASMPTSPSSSATQNSSQGSNSTISGTPAKISQTGPSAEPPAPLTNGVRVTTRSDDERRPQLVSTSNVRAVGKGSAVVPTTELLHDKDEQVSRARQIRYAGGALIGVGVVIASFAIAHGSEDRSQSVLAASTAAVAITFGGVAIYAYGENRLNAAKRVAWSPVLGSGFAGVALAGSLP
jgi:tetratricopeptide (TPR) repeat protein